MRIRSAVLGAIAALPFAASAGVSTWDFDPAVYGAGAEAFLPEAAVPPSEPPVCNRAELPGDEATGEVATGCCWAFHMGRWWCVPC